MLRILLRGLASILDNSPFLPVRRRPIERGIGQYFDAAARQLWKAPKR